MEYGCIGKKLSHSFSKIIHNELADYEYELRELSESQLDEFFEKSDFKAINVTIPYKLDVIKYLDFIDDTARDIGAVNTIVNKNGKLYGYNTDFLGLKALIEFAKISLLNKKVLILGTGGTSLTAMAVAKAMGANEVIRVSRSSSQDTITYECAEKCHTDADIIINTTPCGMFPNIGTSAINLDDFNGIMTCNNEIIDFSTMTVTEKIAKICSIAENYIYKTSFVPEITGTKFTSSDKISVREFFAEEGYTSYILR